MQLINLELESLADNLAGRDDEPQVLHAERLDLAGCSYNLNALRIVDAYLQYLHELGPDELTEPWVDTLVRVGAFVGEVIRANAQRTFHWLSYDDAAALSDKHAEFLGENDIGVWAVLVSDRGTVTLPMNQVIGYLVEGSDYSTYEYAQEEIDIAAEKGPRVDAIVKSAARELAARDNDCDAADAATQLCDEGFEYIQHDEPHMALKVFQSAVQSHPDSADAYHGLAESYRLLGQLELAADAYAQALELDPNCVPALAGRGIMLIDQGDYTTALVDLTKGLELLPDDDECRLGRAECFRALQRYDEALGDYNQVLKRLDSDPDAYPEHVFVDALLGRGRTYHAQQDYTKAKTDFDTALKMDGAVADGLVFRAMLFEDLGDLRAMIRDFESALQVESDWPDLYLYLAWSLATVGDPKLRDGARAVELVERGLELLGEQRYEPSASMYDTAAAAYARSGDFEEARVYQQRALNIAEPDDPDLDAYRQRLELYKAKQPYEWQSAEDAS